MVHFDEMAPAIRELYPDGINELYEIHEWRNASVLFHYVHPDEWAELMAVLGDFRLRRSYIFKGGGNKSLVASALDAALLEYGWTERHFDTQIVVDETTYDSPTHSVDCFKNRVALEVEWNNKDPFYDRDLNNFRLLFELRTIDLGIIITRTDELQAIFKGLGRGSSYGASTTHMGKLLPKVEGGGAGGCPVLVFGIKPSLYMEDDVELDAEELEQARLVERAAPLLDEDD